MKKALFVSTVLGFLASFERSDIRILQKLGYEVHCACNSTNYMSNWKTEELLSYGITIHNISFTRSPITKDNITAFRQLKILMEKEHYDLVHCHTPVGGVLGRLSAKICHVPVVIYTAHGFHFFKGCPLKNLVLFYPIEKFMSLFTDILITINNEDYRVAKRRFKAKRTKRIHGVGVDIERFSVASDCRKEQREELGVTDGEVLLLSVGELDRDKNHIEALKAMKSLASKRFKYLIVGKGGLMNSHMEYIRENGLVDSVKLLGFRQDISELLSAADIFLFPSLFEGLSVALMEAVAAKLPIACSKVRGNVDTVVTPESYFSSKDPETLVKTVERIASMSEQEKKRMVETNYNNLLKYRLSEVQKEMKAIYRIADKSAERERKA